MFALIGFYLHEQIIKIKEIIRIQPLTCRVEIISNFENFWKFEKCDCCKFCNLIWFDQIYINLFNLPLSEFRMRIVKLGIE